MGGTSGRDDYKTARVGEVALVAGWQQVVPRSFAKVKGARLDLKAIRLMPLSSD